MSALPQVSSQHMTAQRHAARASCSHAGFSLLEVLVVVFIIGVLATMFTLSVGVIGGDRELEKEASRLVALIDLAREEAVIQGREIGLRLFKDRYEFSAFYEDFIEYHDEENPDQSEWALLDASSLLGPRQLPEGLMFELQIDGRDIVLQLAETDAEPATIDTDAAADDDANEPPKKTYNPQVMVYSSGDISPFTVLLRREFSNDGTTMEFDIDGSVEITEVTP
ncbi:MAG: type II secretion system minor pseudopilin GspH [Gammaproteobacteria bacterium]